MLELLIELISEFSKEVFSIKTLSKAKKKKHYKNFIRLIIDLSLLHEALTDFYNSLLLWKDSVENQQWRFRCRPNLNSIQDIKRCVEDISNDLSRLHEVLLILNSVTFVENLYQYVVWKGSIFHVWDCILNKNLDDVFFRSEDNTKIYIPNYSLLTNDYTVKDMADVIIQVYPAIIGYDNLENEKEIMKLHVEDRVYNCMKNVSCVKVISVENFQEELDLIISSTDEALKQLDALICTVKNSFDSINGENKSDWLLHL